MGGDSGLDLLGAAFAADPVDPVHLDRLADFHAARGDTAAALACGRCAVALAPDAQRQARLSLFLFNAGQVTEARTLARSVS